jgi:hypothetical protein
MTVPQRVAWAYGVANSKASSIPASAIGVIGERLVAVMLSNGSAHPFLKAARMVYRHKCVRLRCD